MRKYKLATWNIGSMPENSEREAFVLKKIESTEAEFLCLQEVPDNPALLERIRAAGSFGYIEFLRCCPSHIGEAHYMGIAVCSREEPVRKVTHKLIKPFERLVNFRGIVETLHEKYFMAIEYKDLTVVTGHGFPSIRYCRPGVEFEPDLLKKWKEVCISGREYGKTFEDLDRWIGSLQKTHPYKSTVAAADFNVDDPTEFMPGINCTHKDVFQGEFTRPAQEAGYRYKTDAVLIPRAAEVLEKHNEPTELDHHVLTVGFML